MEFGPDPEASGRGGIWNLESIPLPPKAMQLWDNNPFNLLTWQQ
jgi:hypothetical protein